MIKYAVPFLVAFMSNLAMELFVVLPHVGGFVNLLKLSDFGILSASFEAQPVWAAINIVLAVAGVFTWAFGAARDKF